MEISPINGTGIGVIEINNYLRIRTSKNITPKNINLQLNVILKGIDFKQLICTLDMGKEEKKHEYHILILSYDSNLTKKIYKNISGKGNIVKEKSKILVTQSNPILIKDKIVTKNNNEWRFIDAENIYGNSIETRIESIKDKVSALYYLNRYSKSNFKTWLITSSI